MVERKSSEETADKSHGEPHGAASLRRSAKARRMIWGAAAVAALVPVLVAAGIWQSGILVRPVSKQHPIVGKPLEQLHLEPLTIARPLAAEPGRAEAPEGAPALEPASLLGKVTLINYWGTWCVPCRKEFPGLCALAREFRRHSDFQFASVSCGEAGEPKVAQLREETWLYLSARKATDIQVYHDPEFLSRRYLALLVGTVDFTYPTTLLIDREGIVQAVWSGYEPEMEDEMRWMLDRLLKSP